MRTTTRQQNCNKRRWEIFTHDHACRMSHGINLLCLFSILVMADGDYWYWEYRGAVAPVCAWAVSALLQTLKEAIVTTAHFCVTPKRHCAAKDQSSLLPPALGSREHAKDPFLHTTPSIRDSLLPGSRAHRQIACPALRPPS